MKDIPEEKKEEMAKIFVNQSRRGSQRAPQMAPGFGGGAGLLGMGGGNSFFRPPQQPVFNPMMVGQQLMPQRIQRPPPVVMPMVPQQQMQPNVMPQIQQPGPPNMGGGMGVMPQQRPQMPMMQMAPPRFGFQAQPQVQFGFQRPPQQAFGFGQPQQPFGGMNMGGGFGFR